MAKFNETLKFSVAHVFALLSLIFIVYCTFVGVAYWSGGSFTLAFVGAGIAAFCLAGGLYLIQLLKAAERRFARRIWWERVMVLLFALVCCATFVPASHLGTVYSRGEELSESFASAISSAGSLFPEYELFTDARAASYERYLRQVSQESGTHQYRNAGFIRGIELEQVANSLEVMRLKHRGGNYERLQHLAQRWMSDADQGVSSFNVFLLGNVDEIQSAITAWHACLVEWTAKKMAFEPLHVDSFDQEGILLDNIIIRMDSVRASFSERAFPKWFTWPLGLLLFGLLSLPYHLQPRHSKAQGYYRFWRFGHSDEEAGLLGNVVSESEGGTSQRRRSIGFTIND